VVDKYISEIYILFGTRRDKIAYYEPSFSSPEAIYVFGIKTQESNCRTPTQRKVIIPYST